MVKNCIFVLPLGVDSAQSEPTFSTIIGIIVVHMSANFKLKNDFQKIFKIEYV